MANLNGSSNRLRGIGLALAMIVVVAAGILPACVGGRCCLNAKAEAMHAVMPCCAGETTEAPRELSDVRPATFELQTFAVAAETSHAAEAAPARVPSPRNDGAAPLREPSPPLFLLNAQFLI